MRILRVFAKMLLELRRDWWVVALLFSFGPLLVLLYYLTTGGGSTVYSLGVINLDEGPRGTEYIVGLGAQTYPDGRPILDLKSFSDRGKAEASLRERSLDGLVIIPSDFTAAIHRQTAPTTLTVLRDFGNFRSTVPVLLAGAGLDSIIGSARGGPPEYPIHFEDLALGTSGTRTEFDSLIPGLLVFSVILLIFQASMASARETEQFTLRRLALSRMTSLDFLGGITAFELVVGMVSVGLTLGTAMLLGFHSAQALGPLVLVLFLTCLSIIGMALLLSCFVKTSLQAFLVANLPMGILMFFSGAMFPIPKPVLFQTGTISVGAFDILPTTHAVSAINKLCSFSGGLTDIGYELGMLSVLSLAFYLGGVAGFRRFRLREA